MRITRAVTTLFMSAVALLAATAPNPNQELAAGLKAAESYDWTKAAPHLRYAQLHLPPSDSRDRALANVLLLRSTMEQRNLAELTRSYRLLAENPVITNDPELRMWLYIAKGDCDNDLQFPEASRRDWLLVEELAKQISNTKWSYRAKGELAIPAYYMGDLASSRKLVSEALEAATAANDTASMVRLLTPIGAVYVMRGGFDAGMKHLKEADALAAKAGDPFPATVKISELLGLIGMGKLDEAKSLADNIIQRMHAEDRRINEAQTRVMLGSVYEKQNSLSAAIRELTVAIQISKRGNYYHSLSEAEKALGEIYTKQGQYQKASSLIASSIDSMTSSGMISDLPERLLLLAKLRTREGRFRSAGAVYEKAEDAIDAQLALTPLSTKPLLLKSTSEIYSSHFELLAEHSKDAAASYAVIERVRGRMLLDLLNARGANGLNNDTGEAEVSALRLKLASATNAADLAKAREAIFLAQHKRWQDEQAASPVSLKRKADIVLPVTAVQQSLSPAELLVEYVEATDNVYAVVVTRQSIRIAKLGSSRRVDDAAKKFVNAVYAKQSAAPEGSALYAALFVAVPEITDHTRLIVVPDGELYSVPFAALVAGGKHLIETHSIVRAPSASTWLLLRQRDAASARSGLLAVGGVRYDADLSQVAKSRGYGQKLSNLPGSQEEADTAAQTLGPLLKRSVEIEADDATEAAVKSALKQEREVVHLAVHGLAHSSDEPDLAALVLLPDRKAGEDGMLETPEIIRLHLRSELVVLSACETAVGEIQGEEGISNLSRAFLLAGAGTVTSTLWSVDDVFSATLMKYFYASLAVGKSKADSLEDAQRYILNQFGRTAVPWYWAGYVMEGEATSPLSSLGVGLTRSRR